MTLSETAPSAKDTALRGLRPEAFKEQISQKLGETHSFRGRWGSRFSCVCYKASFLSRRFSQTSLIFGKQFSRSCGIHVRVLTKFSLNVHIYTYAHFIWILQSPYTVKMSWQKLNSKQVLKLPLWLYSTFSRSLVPRAFTEWVSGAMYEDTRCINRFAYTEGSTLSSNICSYLRPSQSPELHCPSTNLCSHMWYTSSR